MKSLVIFAIVLAVAAAEPGLRPQRPNPPYINRPKPPTGTGPHARIARSPEPEPQGSIYAHGTQHTTGPNRKPTWEAGYQHKVWENKHGSVSVNAGASKTPSTHTQGQVGVTGEFRFRRSPEPEPQGSIVYQGSKPLSGPDRRPTQSIEYQHKIFENKHGHISASGGALKLPGQHVQPQIGIQGTFRFRRSPEPEPQGSIVYQGQKPLSGPDRRPTHSIDYQHKIFENKHGHISASGGAVKFPGQRVQPQIGVQGTFRFRRSPELEDSIHAEDTQDTIDDNSYADINEQVEE